VVLLTRAGEVAKPGEVGELCISGPCLSRGYLNNREETDRAFVADWSAGRSASKRLYRTGDLALLNEQGDYEFVGRRDRQVKYMGYRIELGDIEHAMLSMEEIRDASAMLAEGKGLGVNELVAVVECDAQVSLSSIRRELARQLPPYMVPKRLIRVDRIPRGDRGKVDWAALASYGPAGD
jgi:acyl-CoA synthetase (AMP-forming)/AMP-acid ligase II